MSAVALGITTTLPAFATGSNTSNPAPTPPTPTPVITSPPVTPPLSTVGAGGCAAQYDDAINFNAQQGLIATDVALGAVGASIAAQTGALIAVSFAEDAQAAEFADMSAGLAAAATIILLPNGLLNAAAAAGTLSGTSLAEGIAVGLAATATIAAAGDFAAGVAGQVFNHRAQDLTAYQATLPQCDTTFTGTVTVQAGGVNVTGDSIFNGNVGVVGDVNVSGNVTASQVHATQGISAHSGAIWLGDPNGTTYSSGITLGGGALSGAGTGGPQAFTGDVTAIAIGNGAIAQNANDTALGTGANATGGGSTALGASATASAIGSIAIGDASATSTDAIAVGTGASASGVGSIAIGQGATATGSIAMGTLSSASNGGAAYGDNSTATGANSTAVGPSATATPDGSAAFGYGAAASLTNQQVFGTSSNTYTAPGITSDLSQQRQSGLLEITTTDASGNLASDNGDTFKAMSRLQAGVAIALAAEAPPLTASQNFGVRLGWGNYQGDANAVAASAIGVLCRGCFSYGDRIAVDASIGAGWSSFMAYSSGNVVAGRGGISWGW